MSNERVTVYDTGFAINEAAERVPLTAEKRAMYARQLVQSMTSTAIATQRRLERQQAARLLIAEAVRAVLIVLLWRRPGRPFRRHLLGG